MSDGITSLTRDDARRHWAAHGLTYDAVTLDNLKRLHLLLDAQMRDGYLRGTFRAGKITMNRGDVADIARVHGVGE